MASSVIHHRKSMRRSTSQSHHATDSDSSSSPHSHSTSNSNSSRGSHRLPAPKQAPTARSLAAAVVAALTLLWLLLRWFPPLSLKTNSAIRAARTIARTKDTSPRSALVQNIDGGDSYGETPLTGSYALGASYNLSQHPDGVDHSAKGSIEFPPLDLWSVLSEEATENQPLLLTFGPRGSPSQPNPFLDSFLDPASKFKSVLASGSDLVVSDDHALLTRRGYKMGDVPNQDRVFIARFSLDFGGPPEEHRERALLMGIFDGHGTRGHAVSHWCALELLPTLATIMRQKQSSLSQPLFESLRSANSDPAVTYIKQSFIEAFVAVDAHEPVKGTAGSTASTLFYPGLGSKVYIANTGDSTTLLATYSRSEDAASIVFQNRKHKPHLKEERQRIEAAGGSVMMPPSAMRAGDAADGEDEPQESSRVIIPDATGDPFGGLALAMSRSIGDYDGKGVGLIAEPDVVPFDVLEYYAQRNFSSERIDDTTWFAIVASDGVYDVLKPRQVAQYVGAALHDANARDVMSPLEACERIVREASRLWMTASASMGAVPYRDDISIAVSKIKFSSL